MRSPLTSLACALALLAGCAAHGPAALPPQASARIARVWHGRVPSARADEYARYLEENVRKFRTLPGNLGYQLMREALGAETHFMVVSYWSGREAIHGYAGEDIRRTRHLPRDAEFLLEPEQTVMNYDLVVNDTGR